MHHILGNSSADPLFTKVSCDLGDTRMAALGTWPFSIPAVEKMKSLILKGQHSTDCIEEAITVHLVFSGIENDRETGHYIVGRGGYPNRDGLVQCDAAVMEGTPGRFGAVAALHGVGTPMAVARRVMERSTHSMLVGEGAVTFAKEQGFTLEDNESMMSPESSKAYQEFVEKNERCRGHDTLGLIALDLQGNITVGVSTSGAPFKSPGRVGDSPLPGCGLYADNTVGAAAATGDGDKIMCFCPSFHVVQLMKQGLSPASACQTVVSDIQRRIGMGVMFQFGLMAMNMKGDVGAASSVEFPYAFWRQGSNTVEQNIQLPLQE
ncbi:N(4)-(Beta-N-acetylglucosaminyl)-L-asparaginase isoform X1 [Acipenser ruthenus]|uniref:N(4)-(Beta-N-acetylglucosaminyl)-L-asparaginase isoform X1 n=2 Tax=Acipenser ruthenus TaxID=7906 RepID=UPI002740B3D7|nr:N(4)-(Beta-N-acetylglucosaminyl)-L-asparaginase isoform X1 [Acipenser ruthenus]